uniref:Protein S-acyltransferase n=1 Tax=Salix viminalis TaxID=40686 RepID=A0A6N2MZS3_SALVM
MEINVFKLCSGLKFLGYLMILLVAAIIAVSYDAIVIVTCGPQLLRGGAHSVLAFAIIMIFHLLLIMLLWSYYRVVFKDPGSVPENWRAVLPEEALEAGSSLNDRPDCVVDTVGLDRRAFCNYCQNGKPPRCHHCSAKDVFSRWITIVSGWSIVSEHLYTFMVTTMDTLVLLPAFINFFGEAKDHSSSPSDLAVIFLAFAGHSHCSPYVSQIVYLDAVLNLAFALSLLCFLVMHASLLSSNTTSIEVYEKRGAARWKYDLGRKKNFEQVFGTKKALWFFPLFSKEDVDNIPALHGLDFPIRADPES